jgi:hypothetical protein
MTVESIWASRAHLYASTLELSVKDFGCYSCYAGLGNYQNHGFIETNEVRSVTVDGFDAPDYVTLYNEEELPGPSGNKHTSGAAVWAAIKVNPRRGGLEGNDRPTSYHRFSRIFCDEGPHYCIGIDGGTGAATTGPTSFRAQTVIIEGMQSSVASLTGAGAVFARNVEDLTITDSFAGYTPQDRQAIQLYNVGSARIVHFVTDQPPPGATRFYADPLTKVVNIEESIFYPDPSTTSQAQRTIVTSGGVTTTTCYPGPC